MRVLVDGLMKSRNLGSGTRGLRSLGNATAPVFSAPTHSSANAGPSKAHRTTWATGWDVRRLGTRRAARAYREEDATLSNAIHVAVLANGDNSAHLSYLTCAYACDR